MENPRSSNDCIENRVGVSQHQSGSENIQRNIAASTSHKDNVTASQQLHGPANTGLNNPAFVNDGVAPPPYSSLDFGNQGNIPNTYYQQENIQPQITVITIEEPSLPCGCTWPCCRRVHLVLVMLAVIAALVKILTITLN